MACGGVSVVGVTEVPVCAGLDGLVASAAVDLPCGDSGFPPFALGLVLVVVSALGA